MASTSIDWTRRKKLWKAAEEIRPEPRSLTKSGVNIAKMLRAHALRMRDKGRPVSIRTRQAASQGKDNRKPVTLAHVSILDD